MGILKTGALAPILEHAVKERLTGAVILVALIVLLVPELLSGPVRPGAGARSAVSAAEDLPLRSYTIQIDDTRSRTPGAADALPAPASLATQPPHPVAQPEPAPPLASADRTVAAEESSPAVTPPAPVASPAPSHAAPATLERKASGVGTSAKGAWAVQLGSFANRTNAERLAQQLRQQGFHGSVSALTSGGRTLYRVRAGTAADRSSAEQLAARVKAAGHASTVVPK